MIDGMVEQEHRPRRRWLSWLAQACLIALTLAIMAAILLPVRRGVSDDQRARNAIGLPTGERPDGMKAK